MTDRLSRAELIERMARIIDPDVWYRGAEWRGRQDAALAKAAAALSVVEKHGLPEREGDGEIVHVTRE
jgi:hypothetical protein